jgi:3'5'-cyclic nucleotide phosphodiesterase/Adenylate and Guanylate cyclase catalytic domain
MASDFKVMTRFAHECLVTMSILTKQLETTLGRCDLQGRCGLHSGPVTAGVLRGEKARFQLFGDTMNMASRIETSGVPGKIHLSNETASLLKQAGKAHWVVPRSQTVSLKGKGEVQTFFAYLKTSASTVRTGTSQDSSDQIDSSPDEVPMDNLHSTETGQDHLMGLVTRCVEVLHSHLLDVVKGRAPSNPSVGREFDSRPPADCVSEAAKDQLRDFVLNIAHLYRPVPFHNFTRASDVVESASEFMTAVVRHSEEGSIKETFGIGSDPLMRFALVFAALILDIDHSGLTNEELVRDNAAIVSLYGEQSAAEQNSLDIAWKVLTEGPYEALRDCICATSKEMQRFRGLLVVALMATDLTDEDRQEQRNQRGKEAFGGGQSKSDENPDSELKALLLYELFIQASDGAHCWKDWATYRNYSNLLFEERYVAWKRGLAGSNDPSLTWYDGEIERFDNFIIPLAKNLQRSGVLGKASSGYLESAQRIRSEWVRHGRKEVVEVSAQLQKKYA